MHALHRPHIPRVVTVTVIAAALATVLTLALATRLHDLAETPAPSGGEPTAAAASTTSRGWNASPFTPLLSASPAAQWASTRP